MCFCLLISLLLIYYLIHCFQNKYFLSLLPLKEMLDSFIQLISLFKKCCRAYHYHVYLTTKNKLGEGNLRNKYTVKFYFTLFDFWHYILLFI